MISSFRGLYFFLSNYHPAQVEYEGVVYPTVEHAYQAAKSISGVYRQEVSVCQTPGNAKRFAERMLTHYGQRSDWAEIKLSVMRSLLERKFQISFLRAQLLNTGDEFLVERNTWGDKFWGEYRGEGENHLGRLLMEVRENLRREGCSKV